MHHLVSHHHLASDLEDVIVLGSDAEELHPIGDGRLPPTLLPVAHGVEVLRREAIP
jgi:hypothetical protein